MLDDFDYIFGWILSVCYFDLVVILLDLCFDVLKLLLVGVEWLVIGCCWNEGLVWFGDGCYFLWSDILNNRIMCWDEVMG